MDRAKTVARDQSTGRGQQLARSPVAALSCPRVPAAAVR